MKTSAAGLVALRVEVSLRESRMDIRALYAAVQVRPSRRPLCSRQNDDFTVSFGSDRDTQSGELAACLQSFELVTSVCRRSPTVPAKRGPVIGSL
jgi:hypothetical protein